MGVANNGSGKAFSTDLNCCGRSNRVENAKCRHFGKTLGNSCGMFPFLAMGTGTACS